MDRLQFPESDWKLLRKRLPGWQSAYMERLIEEYKALLDEDAPASKRFWALDERVRKDRTATGVIAEMKRSNMLFIISDLLSDEAITEEDLSGFSEELKEAAIRISRR